MEIVVNIIHMIFKVYVALIFANVISSWFPGLSQKTFMRFIKYYTDPYLNLFRRFIPPIGGVMDLSPILAFISLKFLEHFITSFLVVR